MPINGWMAVSLHFAKHPVRVVTAFVSTLDIIVVDSSKHDHLAWRMVAEERPVQLEVLRGTN